MSRIITCTKLNRQSVLNKISQVSIFSTYLNLSNSIIQHCIDTGELICSPIREDNKPTCGFRYDNKGRLKFKDFAGYFWGDCFDLVAFVISKMYNQSFDVSNKEDFIKILRHITFTFKNVFYGQEKDINLINSINETITSIRKEKPVIELVVRNWNEDDIQYWSQFGVPLRLLNTNFIYPVEQYYVDRKINPNPKYYYKGNDLCYAYYLGTDRNNIMNIKLYFPNRDKTLTRFITNSNHLEGILNLDRYDYEIIVLTKSTKDRLSIKAELNKLHLTNVGVINIPHETYKLKQNEYDWLTSKLTDTGKIISLMDNDRTGIAEAKWLKYTYDIMPLLIPKKYRAKDFSELVMKNNKNDVDQLVINTVKYINNYDGKNIQPIRNLTKCSNISPF